jgi:hypothetical protein
MYVTRWIRFLPHLTPRENGQLGAQDPSLSLQKMFGAAMLGLAIAFGIGGQDLARKFLGKKLGPPDKEERDDELSPL